ncbi:MAG: SurA N-terminal domain-containing protein [Syntrophales bacterium]
MKKIKFLIILVLAGTFLIPSSPSAEILDRIAAVVNGEVITLSEWNTAFQAVQERIEKGYKGPNKDQIMEEARAATLNRLINSKLIELESKKAGMTVKEEDINAAIRDMLSRQKISLEDLRKNLAKEGITLEQYKEDIRENMTRQRLIRREIGAKVVVNDEEIGEYYKNHREDYEGTEAVHLHLIFLPLPGDAGTEGRDRLRTEARSILDRIRKGESFEAMAYQFTKGPAPEQGGDIGFVERNSLVAEADREAFRLNVGEVSDVIEASTGFYILKVVDKRGAGTKSLADVRNEIKARIENEKMNKKFDEWIADLRKSALIEIK